MNITLQDVQRGYDDWAAQPHNKKWVRKIDGTPIANDIVVRIFTALSASPSDAERHESAVPIGYGVWIGGKLSACAKSYRDSFPLYSAPPSPAAVQEPVAVKVLLLHFEKMQRMASMWLAPDTYVASFPKEENAFNSVFGVPEPLHSPQARAAINKRRDDAFISDIIRMLDGPEQRAIEEPIRSALSASQSGPAPEIAPKFGRFDHHPDPAIDFCIEVEAIQGQLFDAAHGISKPGTEPVTIEEVRDRIARAMTFRVGGDEGAVTAKSLLLNVFPAL
jgi:hypothetical protein